MTNTDKVIEDFFLKHAYDPVYAREYYLRNRKLKGKESSSKVDPQSKVAYSGDPVVIKPGKRMEEDETPNASPSGAKMVDYDGSGLGKATYADGSTFTASTGWKLGDKGWSDKAREAALKTRLENLAKKAGGIGGAKGKELLSRIESAKKKMDQISREFGDKETKTRTVVTGSRLSKPVVTNDVRTSKDNLRKRKPPRNLRNL